VTRRRNCNTHGRRDWMNFLIADTFIDSLARLIGDEQKALKATAFDLQMDSSAPGLSFHTLDKEKDKRFWSVRVCSDIRLIVHRTDFRRCTTQSDSSFAWLAHGRATRQNLWTTSDPDS
jgi:hypothetical protein